MILVGEERNVRAPRGLQDLMTAVGGRNPHGGPNYRIVWGWERKEWKGWVDNDGKPRLLYSPKYPKRDRFYIEVWCDPSNYGTREEWEKQTHKPVAGQILELLGPYPSEGEYEQLWECSDPKTGEYLRPTENMVLRAIRQHKRAREMDRVKRLTALAELEREKEAARNSTIRDAARETAKEFVEKALPGRTVQQLKEELAAPKERKRWRRTR